MAIEPAQTDRDTRRMKHNEILKYFSIPKHFQEVQHIDKFNIAQTVSAEITFVRKTTLETSIRAVPTIFQIRILTILSV